MLFGEGPHGRRAAAHRARPRHALAPRPGLLPRRVAGPGGGRRSRPRCARRRRRSGSTRRRSRSSAGCPSCGCRPATSRSPRSSAGGASPRAVSVVEPRRGARHPPRRRSPSWSTPTTGSPSQLPDGRLPEPGLPDRRRPRRHPLGLHRRHHRPALRLPRLVRPVGRVAGCATSRPTCSPGTSGAPRPRPARHRPTTSAGRAPVNLLDWLLVVLVLAYALSGYWQGFITGAFATDRPAARRPLRRLARADRPRRRRTRRCWVSLGALFIVILAASLGQAVFQFVGVADPRPDHLAAGPGASTRSAAPLLSAVAVLLVAWALGVAISGSRIGGVTPLVRDSAVLAEVDEALPEHAPTARCRRSTTSSAPASSRATSSRSRPSGSSRSAPARSGCCDDPDVERAAEQRAQDPRRQRLRPRCRGLRLPLRRRPADDQRPRRRRGRRPRGDRSATARVAADVVYYNPDIDVAVLAFDSGDAPTLELRPDGARPSDGVAILGYPAGRPVRRAARPDPRPAAAALARHLRRRHGHPRRLLAARPDPPRQLRRPDRRRRRGDVVGVVFAASVTDHDTGYALTADQVAARRGGRRRPAPTQVDRRLRRLRRVSVRSAWPLSAFGISLALLDRPLGRAHLLDLA